MNMALAKTPVVINKVSRASDSNSKIHHLKQSQRLEDEERISVIVPANPPHLRRNRGKSDLSSNAPRPKWVKMAKIVTGLALAAVAGLGINELVLEVLGK
ncbi:hypothetical protein PHMEG_00012871 [Phytophthora megakarya]|uniref:Uncharacterized protein n=1 Tax=Phytophthora megakarya TaxID=4795 RepID=A0A225W9B5_9STRA|nr:hypothetical protein PHMEG_00012871 [Phytophthora megakarya]